MNTKAVAYYRLLVLNFLFSWKNSSTEECHQWPLNLKLEGSYANPIKNWQKWVLKKFLKLSKTKQLKLEERFMILEEKQSILSKKKLTVDKSRKEQRKLVIKSVKKHWEFGNIYHSNQVICSKKKRRKKNDFDRKVSLYQSTYSNNACPYWTLSPSFTLNYFTPFASTNITIVEPRLKYPSSSPLLNIFLLTNLILLTLRAPTKAIASTPYFHSLKRHTLAFFSYIFLPVKILSSETELH